MTVKFCSNAYMTRGFKNEIPDDIKLVLFRIIQQLAAKDDKDVDYLQIFRLSAKRICNMQFQQIEHSQEVPPKKDTLCIPCENPVDHKVYCIDSEEYYTFLLAEEY